MLCVHLDKHHNCSTDDQTHKIQNNLIPNKESKLRMLITVQTHSSKE